MTERWLDIENKFLIRWNFLNWKGIVIIDVCVNERNSVVVFKHNTLNATKPIPFRQIDVSFLCTCDEAFPLTKYMMKPYSQTELTVDKRVFNYSLSRMRRISENASGVLSLYVQPAKVKISTLPFITG